MHNGRSYRVRDFLFWTRRNIFWHLALGIVSTSLYELGGFKWLAIPFTVIALIGTATAFIVTFRNQETYNRSWEARQIWGATMSASRSWAMMCRDYIENREKARELIYRHLAWLTALRYQLRTPRVWETVTNGYNSEFQRYYSIPESRIPLEEELVNYISDEEIASLNGSNNNATHLLSLQSKALIKFREDGAVEEFRFLDMHNALREFCDLQGKSERIKNFPYPRQFVTINRLFLKLFCILLPFGLIQEFDALNKNMTGPLQGSMVWFVIPFSVLISWVFTSLEQVGESTENPFEGGANDVPISQMSRAVEIDMRQMLEEEDLPPMLQPQNNILL